MRPSDYLAILARRWFVILAIVILAAGAAYWTTTGDLASELPSASSYEATSVISTGGLTSATSGSAFLSGSETLATLTTIGDVPRRVAKKLDFKGSPVSLSAQVVAAGSKQTGLLTITAESSDPTEAKQLANLFAEELIGWVGDRRGELAQGNVDALAQRLDEIELEISALGLDSLESPEIIESQRKAKLAEYQNLSQQYSQQLSAVDAPTGLEIIQRGFPVPAEDSGGLPISAPQGRVARIILGLILGLLTGAAIALLLERMDTRLRDSDDVEEHYDLPVLAELPRLKTREGDPAVPAATNPRSPAANAFRLLAAAISNAPRVERLGKSNGAPIRTILVTSADPEEGKTTIVANLAAAYAEMGKRVMVISCDFRRPRIHTMLGVPNSRGLSDALASANGTPILDGHIWRTSITETSIRVVPSGQTPERPGELLSSPHMRTALKEARQEADVVLLDSPPVLAVSDATLLFGEVDAVLVVARSGRINASHAARTSQLLRRLGVATIGVALNAIDDAYAPRRTYGDPEERRGFSRLARHSETV